MNKHSNGQEDLYFSLINFLWVEFYRYQIISESFVKFYFLDKNWTFNKVCVKKKMICMSVINLSKAFGRVFLWVMLSLWKAAEVIHLCNWLEIASSQWANLSKKWGKVGKSQEKFPKKS